MTQLPLRCVVILSVMLCAAPLLLTGCGGCGTSSSIALEYNDSFETIRNEFEFGGASGGSSSSALDDPNRTPQWGSINGVVKVIGSVPALSPIPVGKEQAICGTTAPNEVLEVGSNGGIKNVLLFLNTDLPVNDSGDETPVWVHGSYSFDKVGEFPVTNDRQKSNVLFDQKRCVFLSHVFSIRSDQTMIIRNSDNTLHNTNISAKKGKQANEGIPAQGETTYQPTTQENDPFPVTCNVHPWMRSWMIVRNNPYFDVSKADGSFQIPNIPAGVELEFRIWQEKTGFISAKQADQTFKLNNEAIDVKKGKFKLTLNDNQTLDLKLEISNSIFQ